MDKQMTNNLLSSKCLITGKPVTKILDFGMHPYADTFIAEDQLHLTEPVLPLQCYLNEESGQIQLGYITNAFERYNLYAYSYTSSNSKFATNHWDNYYTKMKGLFNVQDGLVVEIGSNDGYLAAQFIADGNVVIGVDSSQEMSNIASSRGIRVVNKVFDGEVGKDIVSSVGKKANLIIANNVFNHSNTPVSFAQGVYDLLADDGTFVFELPYWKSTVESEKFDQVYHEHVSYFTVKSSHTLLKAVGLQIVDFEVVDYHGGSLRVYAKKSQGAITQKVINAIQEETNLGLFKVETYTKWQAKLLHQRNQFLAKLYTLKANNPSVPIIGVGAAAKANTFLNYYNIDSTVLDYVTDSSEFKINKYTPLTRIPIRPDSIFADYKEAYALILSWNISSNLKKALLEINPDIKFITLDNGSN